MDNNANFSKSFFTNINSEVDNYIEKLKNHEFVSLGTTKPKPDYVDKDIIDISDKNNRKEIADKLIRIAEKKNKSSNLFEEGKNINMKDLEKYIN